MSEDGLSDLNDLTQFDRLDKHERNTSKCLLKILS